MNDLSPAELNTAMALADQLAKSTLVPKEYQGNAANVLFAIIAGKQFQMDPVTSMRSVNVIQGNVSLKPEIMIGLCRRAGHSVQITATTEKAVAVGVRADTGDRAEIEFSMDDAKRANLTGKGPWKSFPKAMLTARAASVLCRTLFQDIFLGAAYVPEELGGDVSDEDGSISLADTEEEVLPSVSDVKRDGMQTYLDAGFSMADAKPYLIDIWNRLNLPSNGSAAFLTIEQAAAFREEVLADVEGKEIAAVVQRDAETQADVDASAMLDEAADAHTIAGDPEHSDDALAVLS